MSAWLREEAVEIVLECGACMSEPAMCAAPAGGPEGLPEWKIGIGVQGVVMCMWGALGMADQGHRLCSRRHHLWGSAGCTMGRAACTGCGS